MAALVAMLGCLVMSGSAANGSSAVLVGRITTKAGPTNARVWIITLSNTGSATANSARILSMTLLQMSGPACTPVVSSSFPVPLGNIAPAGSAPASITIDFSACANMNRFDVDIAYSADAGAESGDIVRHNQFR